MTEENTLTIAEFGAYTNNSMNREGIKKLVDKVNEGGGVEYTAGDNISISDENVISATDTKYTAGNGIEISEGNVISVNGEWTLRASSYDWSDLFEYDSTNNKFKTKKDILFYLDYSQNETYSFISYLPKDIELDSNRMLLGIYNTYTTNTHKIHKCYIDNTKITRDTIMKTVVNKQFTIDNNAIVITSSITSEEFAKSSFIIFIKD